MDAMFETRLAQIRTTAMDEVPAGETLQALIPALGPREELAGLTLVPFGLLLTEIAHAMSRRIQKKFGKRSATQALASTKWT